METTIKFLCYYFRWRQVQETCHSFSLSGLRTRQHIKTYLNNSSVSISDFSAGSQAESAKGKGSGALLGFGLRQAETSIKVMS